MNGRVYLLLMCFERALLLQSLETGSHYINDQRRKRRKRENTR